MVETEVIVEMVETEVIVETVEMEVIVETLETLEMEETTEMVETAAMEVTVETVETPEPQPSLVLLLQFHILLHLQVQASLPTKEALRASRSPSEPWESFYFRTLFDWDLSL
jgi:hypothetical protein